MDGYGMGATQLHIFIVIATCRRCSDQHHSRKGRVIWSARRIQISLLRLAQA